MFLLRRSCSTHGSSRVSGPSIHTTGHARSSFTTHPSGAPRILQQDVSLTKALLPSPCLLPWHYDGQGMCLPSDQCRCTGQRTYVTMCASQVTFSLYALEIALVITIVVSEVGAAWCRFALAQSFTVRKGRRYLISNVISPEVTVGSSECVEGVYPDEA